MPEHRNEISSKLAEQLNAAGNSVLSTLEDLPDERWRAFVQSEEKSVAALVYHIAWALANEAEQFRLLAHGEATEIWTQTWLDEQNRTLAKVHDADEREDLLEYYRWSLAAAVAMVESFYDDQLDLRGSHMPGEPERSVAEWIQVCLIGHQQEHIAHIVKLDQEGAT